MFFRAQQPYNVFPANDFPGNDSDALPFAVGGALLLKGIGGPKGIEDKLKTKS